MLYCSSAFNFSFESDMKELKNKLDLNVEFARAVLLTSFCQQEPSYPVLV